MVFRGSSWLGCVVLLAGCSPAPTFHFEAPADDVTNLPPDTVFRVVFSQGADELLSRQKVMESLRLKDEAGDPVEFGVDFSRFDSTLADGLGAVPEVTLTPAQPLANGWYHAGLGAPLLLDATASSMQRDFENAFGVRIHVGPKPVLARILFCERGAPLTLELTLSFSEPVLGLDAPTPPVTIAIKEPRPHGCSLGERAAGPASTVTARCGVDTEILEVKLDPLRIRSAASTTEWVVEAPLTIDRRDLLFAPEGCRLWRRP